jgi:hypothetical protein
MIKVSVCNDLEMAEKLWQRHWPRKCLFDLWPVRRCFQDQYRHQPHFLVASRDKRFAGMLALSRIDGTQTFGHFPGEVWQGKTWLEQNKIVAADSAVARTLLHHIPEGSLIRYLCRDDRLDVSARAIEDETGYLFFPPNYQYTFDAYWNGFSGKTRKKIRCEIGRLTAGGLQLRHNRRGDLDRMFRMSLERYQHFSYFRDPRFLRAFERLADWLAANGLLRITTVLIGGRIAAVDMGAVWKGTYTVLAGGTDADFPGVAKLINLHHLEWACLQKMTMVDFLCGDFNWKERFHLTPRRLYQIVKPCAVEMTHETRRWNQPAAYAL